MKIYIRNARTDWYILIYSIYAHEKQQLSYVYDGSSSGGNSLPPNPTTSALSALFATIDFILCWIEFFDHNYQAQSNVYIDGMPTLFKKTPVQHPKTDSQKGKCQFLLHDIGDDWYMKNEWESTTPK